MSELDLPKKFELDEQLQKDSVVIGRFKLSLVLMSKDANFPWCILVPMREGKREIFNLTEEDREQLLRESCHLSEVMNDLFVPDKMNVAALGNMVPQLHVHHVARFKDDAAWPKAVWGTVDPAVYEEDKMAELIKRLQSALVGEDFIAEL